MSDQQQRRASVSSPTDDPHLRPLVSAADVPQERLPTRTIPQRQFEITKEHGKRRARNGAYGTEDAHAKGMLGEHAFALYLGIEDRLDTALYERGDGGVDLRYKGTTIDVKTVGRHRADPSLTVDTYQPLTADYYVLVHRIGPRTCRLIGIAPRLFVANAQRMDHGGTEYHLVPQSDLFPLPLL